ncbi:pilus assembly protein PilP [Exercitatus varius]|uniref:pilus assembly protein PilP n=1 Tax=Exercitatus varius TaxID=67857 RepID=UPI00294B2578|nr:pilus assembly protein PilP [Exercitatus varius]MDG2943031.1 pilus assembly protein PilP [Exercitatus varius]
MYRLSLFLFIFVVSSAYGADPFDKNRRTEAHRAQPHPVTATPNQTCHSGNEIIAENINFKRLKLVGLLSEKDRPRALFQTDEKQIFMVKEQDFIAQERLQIQQIGKNAVHFNQWKLDCHKPERLTLKF